MNTTNLDYLMEPVAECLNPAALSALANLRASPEAQERMTWLAEGCNEGRLTPMEQSEYESSVMFASFLGILQSKARRKLTALSA